MVHTYDLANKNSLRYRNEGLQYPALLLEVRHFLNFLASLNERNKKLEEL